MKKSVLLSIVFICSLMFTEAQELTAPSAGDGSESNPYQIATLSNLYWLSQNSSVWDSTFVQTADIDASDTKSWDSGKGFSPIGNSNTKFTGQYNGKGHTIKGLYINRSSSDYIGLFGSIYKATIDSIGLINATFSGLNYVGGITGKSLSSSINHSFVTGSITGNYLYSGGLAGYSQKTSINYCYTSCDVEGLMQVGGLVGYNVTSSSKINYCYNTGTVSGGLYVGGLVGDNEVSAQVNSCYAAGKVTSIYGYSSVESLVGLNQRNGTINNCYWDTETTGHSSTYGTGLTTAQMKQSANLSGLGSFETIWEIREDSTYPALRGVRNNAPFAFPDTLKMKGRTLLYPLLNNDYDYETMQTKQVFKLTDLTILEDEEHLTDYKTYFCLGTLIVAQGESREIGYCVGEVIAPGDTIWGNKAKVTMVQDINTPPVLGEDSISILEDGLMKVSGDSLILDDYDPDNDIITFSGSSDWGVAHGSVLSLNRLDSVIYKPDANWNGTEIINYCVSDGRTQTCNLLYVVVSPVNDAPVLSSVATGNTTNEDTPFTITMSDVTTTDIENDKLHIVLLEGSNYTFIDSTLTPILNYNGTLAVQVAVSDGVDTSNVMTMDVAVASVNDAPVITSAAPTTAIEGIKYKYTITATDTENSMLTYCLFNSPVGMSVSTSGVITWTPAAGITSSGTVTLTVSDGELEDTEDFIITVLEAGTNVAPKINSTAPTIAITGIEYTYTVKATDANGDALTYSLNNTPDGMAISTNGVITWTPGERITTSGEVTVIVSDGELTDTETFTITVSDAETNVAPEITSSAPTTAIVGVEYSYTVIATDANGDALTYNLINAPDGMTISINGIITWTPGEGITTSGEVTLTVSDGSLTDTEIFIINVTESGLVSLDELESPVQACETLEIYPNPVNASQEFTVEINGLTDAELQGSTLAVYNNQGALIYKSNIVNVSNHLSIESTGGFYEVRLVTASGKQITSKMIITK